MKYATFPKCTAEEAAALIPSGALVAFSGFTPAGAAKAVPAALAKRAKAVHEQGQPFKIRVLTGASTGGKLDDLLAEAEAIAWRTPYQACERLRKAINKQEVHFVDMHLSHVAQVISSGALGKIDFAVIEATEVTVDGKVYLSSSIGISPTALACAEKVIIEINRYHAPDLKKMHDIVILPPPPHFNLVPLKDPLTKIGQPFATVDPRKIVAVVEHSEPDNCRAFDPPEASHQQIAAHIVSFLVQERQRGRIPESFLPVQSGVGNIANAVLAGLGESADIPPFAMYSEVFQDAVVDLMEKGRITGVSATSLTLSDPKLRHLYDNLDFFAPKVVLRPQEISNYPAVARRLGLIAINTVLEMDIYGNANSSHVLGTQLMNGIGGSGDFVRNAYLSILVAPSIAKGGKISAVVPMCTHIDHNEHSVQILVTEQGLADLRGLSPSERAHKIIQQCAHPAYRDYLTKYVREASPGHIGHNLAKCFELHQNFLQQGMMLPELQ